MIAALQEHFGNQFEPELLREINQVGTFMEVEAGHDLIRPGQYIRSMPLLLKGSIKVLRPDEEGEELLLYHLDQGDTCAMTMSCCMESKKSAIHAVAETPAALLMIPVAKMEEWSTRYKSWRNYVFASYHHRMMELLESIDQIAFQQLDERLERYLDDQVQIAGSRELQLTHKAIASDLHSNRVVISRLLKKMEQQGKIKLHRSIIEVV
ncbi:Crp/Fnr family transcriptional regulator [Croceiramulus getboli]|nr:Crp/Fnr family transcriptional regulator [Flavobacteriaceae bacterium YJPT1-3]